MKYEIAYYPYEYPGFENMTKKQAEQYFNWYVSIIDERIAYLQNFIKEDGGGFLLDYTPESLKTLWEWFEPKMYLEEMPQEWYEEQLAKQPAWAREFIKKEDLSQETKKIIFDVATYLGETMRKNHKDVLRWDYVKKPKNDVSFNRPVLIGFSSSKFDPRLISQTCCYRYLRTHEQYELYDAYLIWQSKIKAD